MTGGSSSRLVFANQLRGVAALSVALSHLVGVFWLMRDVVGYATFSPIQQGDPPPIVGAFNLAWFQAGPFGVGLFFLISGLVVPISLGQHSSGRFLLARLLRIYPTYIAALAIELVVLYSSSLNWERPFFYSSSTIFYNALLIHDLVGAPSIDMVNWTLGIELKFYFLLALAAAPIRAGRPWPLFAYAILLCIGNIAVSGGALADRPAMQTLSYNSVYLVFMFIGVLFNFRLRRLVSRGQFALSILAMLLLFLASWRVSAIAAQMPSVAINYLYALALFGLLFAFRRFVREFRLFDFMASISYPFYLLHTMIGYSILKLAMLRFSIGYLPALALTFCGVGIVATALHLTVERATIKFGRALQKRRPPGAIDSRDQLQKVPLPFI